MESNSAISETTWPKDALEAVKQDPAILDVQILADSSKSNEVSPELEFLSPNPVYFTKGIKDASESSRFEEMVKMQKAALLSLAPDQFEMLLLYAGLLRRKRLFGQKHFECAFCKKNGEPASWYSTHLLKDKRGRVRCPVLRVYRCPVCGASGDHAHTIKYCPENFDAGLWSR